MIKAFLKLFKPKPKLIPSFSDFFRYASKEEKEKLFLEVAREASEDQREILRRFDEKFPNGV